MWFRFNFYFRHILEDGSDESVRVWIISKSYPHKRDMIKVCTCDIEGNCTYYLYNCCLKYSGASKTISLNNLLNPVFYNFYFLKLSGLQ